METFTNYQDKVLEEWNKYGMYKIFDINKSISIEIDKSIKKYSFISGPPFCSGNLHCGHLAVETIKSTILNYKAMIGFHCDNKLGYDCHGLPIESVANKALNISTLEDLEKVGIVKFNQFCKDTIKQCENDWEPIYNRIGRWVNFTDVYKTMDKSFMESVWWAFSELYRKGLIYRGYKITPYSYPLQSPLSNFEASQNYKDVDCKTVYVRFKITNPEYTTVNHYIIAWTTTPWTLPANIALCVNAELDYEFIEDITGDIVILGKDKWKNAGIKMKQIIKTVKGSELIGLTYKPLFDTYSNFKTDINYTQNNKFYRVLSDKFVEESGVAGTNIVHLAPVFGEDDYRVCKEQCLFMENDIPTLEIIDNNCKYLSKVGKYAGLLVFDAEQEIIKELKENKCLVKIQQIRHEYPYCYRTDTPLVYRTCESFYVNIQVIKERMIELNSGIKWYPESVGSQRFNKWLEGARDWCISRTRYFGTPIPAWIADDGSMIVISSVNELEKYCNKALDDIHPENVNDIIISVPSPDGITIKKYRRVKDIFDCWFESGSVPFAQCHYPFENRDLVENNIKMMDAMCDFIVEGLDQTRGWFYTLLVLSTALFNVRPAKSIMAVGLILDENKKKISKKTKNYIDPLILIDRYGADAIRLYLLQSAISNAEPLAFKEDDIKIINKDLITLKNCMDFLIEHITNQKHQNIEFDILAYQKTENAMDKWIVLHINNITKQIITFMDNYQIAKSTRLLIDVIEDITNWYVKFNRDRLKGKYGVREWLISTSTLYHVMLRYITLLAPFAPFISQILYDDLEKILRNVEEFIHLNNFSREIILVCQSENIILETFELLKRVSKLVRMARMKTTTHTSSKTPIKSCYICMDNPAKLEQISNCIDLIQAELNVIDIKYGMLSMQMKYRIMPNRAVIGKKYRKQAGEIYKAMENLPVIENRELNDASFSIDINEKSLMLEKEDFSVEPIFEPNDIFDNDGGNNILIKLDFTYDTEIENIANLKRFVVDIQQTRKHMGLKPWNKISIEICQDDFNIVSDNIEYIKKRLECDVNPCSAIMGDKCYKPNEDDIRCISYSVKLL